MRNIDILVEYLHAANIQTDWETADIEGEMGRGVSHALQICLSDWSTSFRPCCSAMNNDSAVKGLLRSKYCCPSNAGISLQVLYNSISHGCIVERILV